MKFEAIPLAVKDVRNGHLTNGGHSWQCDVTFGTPHEWGHDDPTITVSSDEVEKYPQPGDVMLVFPPRVVGYADLENAEASHAR